MGREVLRLVQMREASQDRGPASREMIPHADVRPLFDQLDTFNVGLPINWHPYEGDQVRVGHALFINPKTVLYIMADGVTVLKTPRTGYPEYTPARTVHDAGLKFSESSVWPTKERVREYILDNPDDTSDVIRDTSENEEMFHDAIQVMRATLEKAKDNREKVSGFLSEITPTDIDTAEQMARADAQRRTQELAIDSLAKERLHGSKTLVLESTGEAVGFVVPAPQSDDETKRKLIFLKQGDVIVADITADSEAERAYADGDTSAISVRSQEAFLTSLEGTGYDVISTSLDLDDTVIEESSVAARGWIERQRALRESLLQARLQTSTLLAEARDGITERPIEEIAKDLLGKDFLGVEAVQKLESYLRSLGKEVSFNLSEIPEIHYSKRDLELAKNSEMLVLRPRGIVHPDGLVEDLALDSFIRLFDTEEESARMFRKGVSKFFLGEYNADTVEDYAVFPGSISLEWALVGKEVLPQSVNKLITAQDILLEGYAQDLRSAGADHTTMRRRTPMEIVWDTILYYINTDKKLLATTYDLTNSRSAKGERLVVGKFGDEGLAIGTLKGTDRKEASGVVVGVCSCR